MKNKTTLTILITIILCMTLTGCCMFSHTWQDATCTEPATCSVCGVTSGEPLGHTWIDATCTEPKRCEICGIEEGKSIGHIWEDATEEEPKTCTVCKITEGEPLPKGKATDGGVDLTGEDFDPTDPEIAAATDSNVVINEGYSEEYLAKKATTDRLLEDGTLTQEEYDELIAIIEKNYGPNGKGGKGAAGIASDFVDKPSTPPAAGTPASQLPPGYSVDANTGQIIDESLNVQPYQYQGPPEGAGEANVQ